MLKQGMDRKDKAIEIFRWVVAECPGTRAAQSATKRLAYVDAISTSAPPFSSTTTTAA